MFSIFIVWLIKDENILDHRYLCFICYPYVTYTSTMCLLYRFRKYSRQSILVYSPRQFGSELSAHSKTIQLFNLPSLLSVSPYSLKPPLGSYNHETSYFLYPFSYTNLSFLYCQTWVGDERGGILSSQNVPLSSYHEIIRGVQSCPRLLRI